MKNIVSLSIIILRFFMNCPSCEKKIDLSNKMYFKSLLGKHICPSCQSVFKLVRGSKYVLWIVLSIVWACLASLYLFDYLQDSKISTFLFSIYLIVLFFLYCYIDRKIENTLKTKLSK